MSAWIISPGIVLVVPLRLCLELLLELRFDLGKSLEAVLQTPEPFVRACVDTEVVQACPFENGIHCRTGNAVFSLEVCNAEML